MPFPASTSTSLCDAVHIIRININMGTYGCFGFLEAVMPHLSDEVQHGRLGETAIGGFLVPLCLISAYSCIQSTHVLSWFLCPTAMLLMATSRLCPLSSPSSGAGVRRCDLETFGDSYTYLNLGQRSYNTGRRIRLEPARKGYSSSAFLGGRCKSETRVRSKPMNVVPRFD